MEHPRVRPDELIERARVARAESERVSSDLRRCVAETHMRLAVVVARWSEASALYAEAMHRQAGASRPSTTRQARAA